MSTELEQVNKAVAEFDKVAASIGELKKKFGGLVYDVTTTKGMEDAKVARAAWREPRYNVEKLRKGAKAPILELGRKIDSEAARITAELEAGEKPFDDAIKAEETRKEREKQAKIEAEAKRVQDIQDRLTEIRGVIEVCTRYNCTAAEIAEHTGDIERIAIDDSFQEFRQQAEDAKAATLSKLREAHAAALAREEEQRQAALAQAELLRLRAEAEQARLERERIEAQARAEREEKERQERLQREAAEKAERERLAAEQAEVARQQREAQAKIDAENKRLADERAAFQRQQDEARRKAEGDAAAERKRKEDAERLAKKAKFPGERAIVDALMEHFGVPEAVINAWLAQLKQVAA